MDRKNLIDRLNDYSSQVEITLAALADLPDLPGGHLYQTTSPGELYVRLPMTEDGYKIARRRLGRAWRRKTGNPSQNPWTADDGSIYYHFEHKTTGVELVLNFDTVEPGATCTRRQVGERVQPVYEIVCH